MITLHPLTRDVIAEVIAANRASVAFHHPWITAPCQPAAFEEVFAAIDSDRAAVLLARATDSDALVGLLNFSQIARKGFQNAYLGFYGMIGQTGGGRMTEAVRTGLAHAFGPIGLHRIEANVQPGNARSLALVARAGFRKEGFSPRYHQVGGKWRDHERWACLSDEFSA